MEKIQEKIQKLLSLATSSNENEAKLAAEKANELMVKYNLGLIDIQEAPEYEQITQTVEKSSPESKFVLAILSCHFFVNIVKNTHQRKLHFLGKKVNLENALYVNNFLTASFRSCWKEYQKKTGCATSARQSYYYGLYSGLNESLKATRKKVEDQYSVVVVNDKALDAFMKTCFGKLANSRTKVNTTDRSAFCDGKEDGAKLKISKAVSTSTKTNLSLT